jgi:hypothetical protein
MNCKKRRKLVIKIILLCITAFVYLIAFPVHAQNGNGITLAIINGTGYRSMSPDVQKTWFIGVLDGIMAESVGVSIELFQAGKLADKMTPETMRTEYALWMGQCIDRYSIEQFQALFNKRLEQKPEVWHAPAAFTVRQTVIEFCDPIRLPNIRSTSK